MVSSQLIHEGSGMAMFDYSHLYYSSQPDIQPSPSLSPERLSPPNSPAPTPLTFLPPRASLSSSDPASTTFGSENERIFSSGDEDSMEFLSDTAYDSVATRTTLNSNDGLPGLEIQKLFEGSPPPESTKHPFIPLEHLLAHDSLSEQSYHDLTSLDGLDSLSTPRDDQSSSQDVEYLSTPLAARENQAQPEINNSSPASTSFSKRLLHQLESTPAEKTGLVAREDASPALPSTPQRDIMLQPVSPEGECLAAPVAPGQHQPLHEHITSSPPITPHSEGPPGEGGHTDPWPCARPDLPIGDEQRRDEEFHLDSPSTDPMPSPDLPQYSPVRLSPPPPGAYPHSTPHHRQDLDNTHEEKRMSIFDWSEQQRSDRDSLYGSSPRPRTVHCKQSNDPRGGRPTGRRAPNPLHFRSQSVPAAKESYMDSDPAYPPAKFGTWRLGNKGVSEEWTDDFEFDEDDYDVLQTSEQSATGMKVPQAIIDRQASVHGQFGQVQEFMLLVQELKRLRHQGSMLGVIEGAPHQLWEDAESIINLATLNEDDDDDDLMPPQSPGFPGSFDDFEEESSLAFRSRQNVMPSLEDVTKVVPATTSISSPASPPIGRPRGESLAQTKQFLQTIHQNRTGTEASSLDDRSHPSKLPFDTQDLRDLVTRTGVVTRALKDVVRKAEGVCISLDGMAKEQRDPPFSQIFKRLESTSPTSREPGLPKSTSLNSYMSGPLASNVDDRDLSGHLSLMTVV